MFDSYNKVQQAVLETTLGLIIEKELQSDFHVADCQEIRDFYRKHLSLF